MFQNVRKFGLAYCDLPTMVWNVSCILRPLTLNIDSRNKTKIPLPFYFLTAVLIVCYFYVYLVSMIWFVFWRCMETGDVLPALVAFSLGASSEIGMVKFIYIYLKINRVQRVVHDCLANNSLVVPGNRFSENLLKTLREVKKRALFFWIFIIANGVIYLIKPIILPGRHLMEDSYIIYGLEPIYESPNYEFAFLLMTIGVLVTCYLPSSLTLFFLVITGYTEAQMLSWSQELIHMWEDAKTSYIQRPRNNGSFVVYNMESDKNKALNEFVRCRLKDIIKGHVANINLLGQIEEIFKGAIAIEFCILMVSLVIELLGGLENTYLQLPFALVQVAMDCFTGQRLMDASVVFERAVYDCKWDNFDKNNLRTVLIMLQMSQKTMTLSAGGVTKLCFMSFMAIAMVGAVWGTLRKFGLEHCDLPTMIWNVSVMLRALTLNVDNRCKKRIPTIFYILTYGCAVCYYYTYLLSMLWFLFVHSPQTGDLPAAMVVMSLGVCSEIATLKLMFMFSKVKRIRRVVAEYLKFDARNIPGSRFSRNLLKELKEVKKRAIGFWILILVNAVVYIIMPVFLPGRHLQEDLYIIYGLEPMLESPNYEIAFFIMSSCVWFICYTSANITAFFIIIVGYTEAQMLSLSEELINVWDDAIQETYNTIELKIELTTYQQNTRIAFDDETEKKINIEVKKRLVYLIQNHSKNIRLIGEVESIFRISIAVGFVCLIIGLIAELLGGLENTFLEIPFTLSQVAIDCWTGQRLMDASNIFAQAVYDCKWENFDRHNMKIVLVMLQISQKTLTLSAGGMTMLSFSCLMSILRSIYSAYTTLRSMM